jgi:hypothetical protein
MRVTVSGAAAGSFAEHFGDSEIEQLGNALGGDQDVIRLQVPMYDQLLVRELNGFADRQHQLDALPRVSLRSSQNRSMGWPATYSMTK